MTTDTLQAYQGYRMMTVVVPFNAHHDPQNRQRNRKMHCLMRMRAYFIRGGRHYYRIPAQNAPSLQYGALCLRTMRQCKKENLLSLNWLSKLIEQLKEENLCPCIFVFDDNGVDNATHLATIPISSIALLPQAPTISVDAPEDDVCMAPGHVPAFAFQMLTVPAAKPVETFSTDAESYCKWLGIPQELT